MYKQINLRQLDPWVRLAVLFILAGILYRLVRYLVRMPLWGDEVMLGLNFIDRQAADLFAPLLYNQVLPAGYLALSWFLMQLAGFSEWVLRFPALLFGIASLIAIYQLGRRLSGLPTAALAVATFAASYYSTRHGVEFKPYAADVFFAALCLLVCFQVFRRQISWLWMFPLILIAPLFSYPSVFAIAGAGATLVVAALFTGDRGLLVKAVIAGIFTCVFFALYYLGFVDAQSSGSEDLYHMWSHTFVPESPLEFPLWLLGQLSGRMLAYPVGGKHFGSILTLGLCVLGTWHFIRERRYFELGLLLSPVLFTLFAAVLHLYPFGGSARFAQHLAPTIVILVGAGIKSLCRKPGLKAWPVLIWSGLCGLLCVAGTAHSVLKPYKSKDALEVRAVVEDLALRGCEEIFSLNPANTTPVNFAWYLQTSGRLQPLHALDLNAPAQDPVCLISFSSERFPEHAEQRRQISEALGDYRLTHTLKDSVQIYGHTKNHPHSYRVNIWRRP